MASSESATGDVFISAMDRLRGLVTKAEQQGLRDANAAAIATVDGRARPSVRMVNILAIEDNGLVFFTQRGSGKSRQMTANPNASLCFYWPDLQMQVTLEGRVAVADDAEADHYWKLVSRERQVYTWLSGAYDDSTTPGELRKNLERDWHLSGYAQLKRPDAWQAWRLAPVRMEFWPAGWRQADERVLYSVSDAGDWEISLSKP